MAKRLTLLPHQREQTSLSTGAGGLGMSSGRSEKDARVGRDLGSNWAQSWLNSLAVWEMNTEEPTRFRTGEQYLGGNARPPR